MSFAKVYSAQPTLLRSEIVDVEVDVTPNTLHAFSVVGLPDKAVEESRDRVSAAIKNSNFPSPKSANQKIIVSLAPADVRKEGPLFDLAIALCYLAAVDEIRFEPAGRLFLGELALDGELRPVRGVLPLALEARERGFREIYVPSRNADEAAIVEGIEIYAVKNLREIIEHLDTKEAINSKKPIIDDAEDIERFRLTARPRTRIDYSKPHTAALDIDDIRGQESAKRGLEIAGAGGHNIALVGPAGTGKTMLAKAFTGILPPLQFEEALEVTSIHSVSGGLEDPLIIHPPFRSPHHTASYVSMVGGGTTPKPGEVTLSHRGVLFLDEFPEFDRRVIEALRQPLEDRVVSVTRAKGSARFPANFILVAAMNPCPCGNFGTDKLCICNPGALQRYSRKLSGPIMDRLDLWIDVPRVEYENLSAAKKHNGEESAKMRERVAKARALQAKRFAKAPRRLLVNADMSVKELDQYVPLEAAVRSTLNAAAEKLALSARAYHRCIKLARTLADLADNEQINEEHILEALSYRPRQMQI
jgi:magnesium chelatase family protein